MFTSSDVSYVYDGTFEGLLSVVFTCFQKKTIPLSIAPKNAPSSFSFFVLEEETNLSHFERVKKFLIEKCGETNYFLVKKGYLSSLKNKEMYIINYIILLTKVGKDAYYLEGTECVAELKKTVKSVDNEAHLLKGFVRFREQNGVLVAKISPSNRVLSLIASHFVLRFKNENFIIYDSIHKEALIYNNKTVELSAMEIKNDDIFFKEGEYEKLWKGFVSATTIEERKNPKCQMAHMPKRYWDNMTENRGHK